MTNCIVNACPNPVEFPEFTLLCEEHERAHIATSMECTCHREYSRWNHEECCGHNEGRDPNCPDARRR